MGDNDSRQTCKQAIIKLSLAYSSQKMLFIGQNLKMVHSTHSFLESLIFFWSNWHTLSYEQCFSNLHFSDICQCGFRFCIISVCKAYKNIQYFEFGLESVSKNFMKNKKSGISL